MQTNTHKILIVEDEKPLANALMDKLIYEGFKVLNAKNGEEGLEFALREHPDLILLDIVMPVMDGMTTAKRIREDVWGKKAKIIFLTNLSDNAKLAEAMGNEVFEYLVKSDWKIEDVVTKVRECLDNS